MLNKTEIFKQLSEMHAPQDKVVLVHSSLRAIGDVEGRGEGLLDAFVEYFTAEGGLLCIPTHTWATVGKENTITLDMTNPKTCIGTLPDIAARLTKVRTLHPTHSMAVFGEEKRAKEFASGEEQFSTPANPKGCYGKIFDNEGYILLIGVGHNRNTYLHCVEEMLGVPNRLAKNAFNASVKYPDGTIVHKTVYPHRAEGIGDVSRRYVKYESAFRFHGAIQDGFIGDAHSQLCSAVKMKAVMELINQRSHGIELFYDDEPLDESLYK